MSVMVGEGGIQPRADPWMRGDEMDDLTGSATERMQQLALVDTNDLDAAWLSAQLTDALLAWQGTEDELRLLREGREDY